MIASLRIENFALIDSVKIQFHSGFTVITGETGSGKSILLNALNLILGERANFSVIGNRGEKSIVEAEIDIKGFGLNAFFKENELDYFDQTIVRREISKQGRSRAFINDTPVQLSILKAFSSQLIHIHSQYNTLELKEMDFQLKVLDTLAGTTELRTKFAEKFNSFKQKEALLKSKTVELQKAIAQADYNLFQLKELEALQLHNVNYSVLQKDLQKGENADEIRNAYSEIVQVLTSEMGVLERLGELKTALSKRISLDESIEKIYQRIESVVIELDDCAEDSAALGQEIEFDPRKLNEMVAQLDAYNRAVQKHNVQNQEELISLENELSEQSSSHERLKEEINQLSMEVETMNKSLQIDAKKLHDKRVKSAPSIEDAIQKELAGLKLENTELIFQLSKNETINSFGSSKLEMLFSPNKGIAPVPVHQAASGGELSRVMLALQSLMSAKAQLRTMLFDEIDTGVSGDVAQKMGVTLKKMGEGMQVIAITHLPQVAAKGGQHLKVQKNVLNEQTVTSVIELNTNERIEETARLMSGDKINNAALENAKALMD